MSDERIGNDGWVTVDHPGQFGKKRDELEAEWNKQYGEGNWRVVMQTSQGRNLTFDDIFSVFVEGYVAYFRQHPDKAEFVTKNFAYAYDKTEITREQAFDPRYLYERPGIANQFHHVAMNIALERVLKIPFQGEKPLKVRLGKPDVSKEVWPEGWAFSPCYIPCTRSEEILAITFPGQWWANGTIEDYYQKSKCLQIRSEK